VRRLIVAVAIVGMSLMSYLYFREKVEPLARGYREIAGEHVKRQYQLSMELIYRSSEKGRIMPLIRHRSAMEAKYSRAARYPWLPVAPDPPEPK
jgi:hypothetical protein